MNYSYDPETDILLIQVKDTTPDYGEQEDDIIMHYTDNGGLVEIEILDATENALGMLEAMLQMQSEGIKS